MSARFPEHSPIVFSSATRIFLGGEPLVYGALENQEPDLKALYAQRTPLAAEMGALTQTIPQPLSSAGTARKLAAATGLRCALFALCARGVASGEAPQSTRAPPLGKSQAYTARDLLASPRLGVHPQSRHQTGPANGAGRGWALGAPPAEGAAPRAHCKDPESCESSCGLRRSQIPAPSFRAGPPLCLSLGRRLPPTLSAGPSSEPQGRSRSPRLLPRLAQSEAQRRIALVQPLLDSGLGISGGAGPEPGPRSGPQALGSSGVSWRSGRA